MIRGGAFLAGNARRVSVQAALGLAMLALFMRVLIPAGWMPASAERGFSIILCTGQGAMSAWIDEKGELHEGKPGDDRASHPCVFAGFGAAFDLRPFDIAPSLFVVPVVLPFAFARGMEGVGHGLAAPPPPPTGPPGAL